MEEDKRSRKKKVFKEIVEQVEFYFSASNLAKDRFTNKLLAECPDGVELSVFLKYNRLRALTTDTTVLAKALKQSENLVLSEDCTRIKPKFPVQPKENVDESTIYIEHLPVDSSIEWLKKLFTSYGTVDYVSLPKFHNGKIKGFAFIEFAKPESAQAAIEDFKKCGSYLSLDMAPSELCSITSHDQEKKNMNRNGSFQSAKKVDQVVNESNNSVNSAKRQKTETDEGTENCSELKENELESGSIDENISAKRKRGNETDLPEESDVRQEKKLKDSNIGTESEDPGVAEEESISKKRKSRLADSEELPDKKFKEAAGEDYHEGFEAENCDVLNSDEERDNKMESRKMKRRKKSSKKGKETAVNSGVQILAKNDWKRLRNRYLDSQRLQMAHLKKTLAQNYRFKRPGWKDHKDGFDQGKSVKDCVQTPGSVVKITLDEPVLEVKEFKKKLKNGFEGVQYVDVREGSSEIYVRLESADSASTFNSSSGYPKTSIISGNEERRYWSKISSDREKTMGRQNNFSTNRSSEATNETGVPQTNKGMKTVEMVAGSIVKLVPTEPVIDITHFKAELKSKFKGVKYIDLQEGSSEVYVRMDSKESADTLVDSTPSAFVIEGEEESDYWIKINNERKNKYENKSKVKKRGREKIIRKAEDAIRQHIYFGD